MRKAKPAVCDAVLFDIDNVLVDTRRSYLDAIRWTIEIYLTAGKIPFFSPGPHQSTPYLLSAEDVDKFKLLGGFNDDWDCCYGLLVYLLTLPVKKRKLQDLKPLVQLEKFSKKIPQRPLGVAGIVKMLGRPHGVMIEKIAQIFQEVYLGSELLRMIERRRPVYWKKRGLIQNEKLIFKKPILDKIKENGIDLGIATGRSYAEASYILNQFGILELFSAITTMDDVRKAEREKKQPLRKPNPFSVIETARKLGAKKRFFYVGDLPDDVLAANQAKSQIQIKSVAFPGMARNMNSVLDQLKKCHPDHIIQKPADLLKLI